MLQIWTWGKAVCAFHEETSSAHIFLGFLPVDSCSICFKIMPCLSALLPPCLSALIPPCLSALLSPFLCPWVLEALLPPRWTRSVPSKWPSQAPRCSRRRPWPPWHQLSSLRFFEPRSGSQTVISPAVYGRTAKLRMAESSRCLGVEGPRTLLWRQRRAGEAFLGVRVGAGRDLQYGDMVKGSTGVWILGKVRQLDQRKQASC